MLKQCRSRVVVAPRRQPLWEGVFGEFVDGRKEGLAGDNPRLWISVEWTIGPLHSFSGVSVLTRLLKKKLESSSGPKRRGLLASGASS